MWEVWQYCAASLAVLQYEEAGRRYPGTGRTGHEYSSTDTWPYHSVSPCQVWQYGADFLMYPSITSHSSRTYGYYTLLGPAPSGAHTRRLKFTARFIIMLVSLVRKSRYQPGRTER